MRINTNNNVSFQQIYYTRWLLMHESEMSHIIANPTSFAIEEKPVEIAKEIMKSSRLFRDLDNAGTDMFVYMGVNPLEPTNPKDKTLLGVLHAMFKNPHTEKLDSISIQATGFSKDTVFEKIKEVADKLPYINELKENIGGKPSILRTSDQWWIAYNK